MNDFYSKLRVSFEETQKETWYKPIADHIIDLATTYANDKEKVETQINAARGKVNVKDIELWKKKKQDLSCGQLSLEEIFRNIEVYYIYNELTELLMRVQAEKLFNDKKEFMSKPDFKIFKDYIKELLEIYEDTEDSFDVEKLKNNDDFALHLQAVNLYLKEIYLIIKIKYIQSIMMLGKNYKYYN